MKTNFCLINSLFFFLLISCSANQSTIVKYDEEATVKDIVLNHENDVVWTKELEGALLSEEYETTTVGPDVVYNVQTAQILGDSNKSVYPALTNFGSLDTTGFTEKQKTLINDFCKALSENIFSGPEQFFQSKYLFSLFFFKQDLQNDWITYFEEDFPVKPEDFEINDKSIEQNEEQALAVSPIFSKWLLGKPYFSENLCVFPVRFFAKKGSIDVTISMNKEVENCIYEIKIEKWEKSDGK